MVADPATKPYKLPEASIEAIVALLVAHVPPVTVLLITLLLPTQTKEPPLMAGGTEVTVIACVT
jgi:hypothetical protein